MFFLGMISELVGEKCRWNVLRELFGIAFGSCSLALCGWHEVVEHVEHLVERRKGGVENHTFSKVPPTNHARVIPEELHHVLVDHESNKAAWIDLAQRAAAG